MDRLPTDVLVSIFQAAPLFCLKNLSACNRRLRRIFCSLVRRIVQYRGGPFMTIYPKLQSVFVAIPGLTVYIPYPEPIITRSVNNQPNHFAASNGIMWDTPLTMRDDLPGPGFRHKKAYIYNGQVLCIWKKLDIPPRLVLKLIVKLPDYYSAELASPDPPVLLAILDVARTLPNPIKLVASTRFNCVTYTNNAYRCRKLDRGKCADVQPVASTCQ
jgi:hypothetical protein